MLVFWVAAMLGVTLATLLTAVVEHLTRHESHLVQGLSVFVAQCVGFGLEWIGRYLILDKWLFKVTHHGEEPEQYHDVVAGNAITEDRNDHRGDDEYRGQQAHPPETDGGPQVRGERRGIKAIVGELTWHRAFLVHSWRGPG